MADDKVAVAPASQAPTVVPFTLRMYDSPDVTGTSVKTQAVCIVDEFGRPVNIMNESTAQDILQSIRELHALMANNLGGFMPSTRGLQPQSGS